MYSKGYGSCIALVDMSTSNSNDIWRVLMWEYRFVDTVCRLVAPVSLCRPHRLTRQEMCICNMAARSSNHCCCGKAMSITQLECVYL